MKEKIMAALRSKYANYGLSDKALQGIAAMLAITVTDEANIETAISAEGVVEALKGVQGEVDSRVTTAVAKVKAENPGQQQNPGGADPNTPNPTEAPAWLKDALKGVTDKLETVTTELNNFKQGQAQTSQLAQLEAALAKTPDAFKNAIVESFKTMKLDDEAFKGYVSKLEPSINAVKQESNNQELNKQGQPIYGSKDNGGGTSFIDQMKGLGKTEVKQPADAATT